MLLRRLTDGAAGDAASSVRTIARIAALSPTDDQISAAVAARLAVLGQVTVSAEAAEVVARVHAVVGVGILSNCVPETAVLWPSMGIASLVDELALSCTTGLVKPALRSYRAVLARLGVHAESLLFVTDGEEREVAAAWRVGMRVVRLARGASERPVSQGAITARLSEVLYLVLS